MITGKEALIALANGEEVEYLYGENNWLSVIEMQVLITAFTGSKFKFRLKPRTITINGVEVPAPFEPKEGDVVWVISDYQHGYRETQYSKSIYNAFGAWRTEDEIKQVVAALRSIFRNDL